MSLRAACSSPSISPRLANEPRSARRGEAPRAGRASRCRTSSASGRRRGQALVFAAGRPTGSAASSQPRAVTTRRVGRSARRVAANANTAFTIAQMLFPSPPPSRRARGRGGSGNRRAIKPPNPNELTVLVRLLARLATLCSTATRVAAKIAEAQARRACNAGDGPRTSITSRHGWRSMMTPPAAASGSLVSPSRGPRDRGPRCTTRRSAAIDNMRCSPTPGRRGAWSEALAGRCRRRTAWLPRDAAPSRFGADDLRFHGRGGRNRTVASKVATSQTSRAPAPVVGDGRRCSRCSPAATDVAVLALSAPGLGIGPLLDPQTPVALRARPATRRGPAGHPRRLVVSAPITPPEAGASPALRNAHVGAGPPTSYSRARRRPRSVCSPRCPMQRRSRSTATPRGSICSMRRWLAPCLPARTGGRWTPPGSAPAGADRRAPSWCLWDCAGRRFSAVRAIRRGDFRWRSASPVPAAVIASLSAIPDREGRGVSSTR